MFKLIGILFIAALVITYFVDPSALTPWKDAAGQMGKTTAVMVKKTGEEVAEKMNQASNPGKVVDEDDVKK